MNNGTHSPQPRPEPDEGTTEHSPGVASPSSTSSGRLDLVFSEANLDRVLDAAREAVELARRDRAASPALASRIEGQPLARARLLIENDPRFQTWGLVQELMDRSEQAIFNADPRRAVHLARLATAVASRMRPGVLGEALTCDLRARTWASFANACRYASRFRAATEAIRQAGDLIARGTGDPLEEANLLSIRASMAWAETDHSKCVELLERAERIYRELGESRLLGKILVQKAGVVGWRDPNEACILCRQAETQLADGDDPKLFLMARHNRIAMLTEAGQVAMAEDLLERSRHLYRQFHDEWTFLHLAWAEAQLAWAGDHHSQAQACYEVLLDALLDRGYRLDSALCALELAGCHLAQGETKKASELAAAMAQHLRSWGAHARAREAWAMLQHALAVETATGDLVRQLARYLHRAWRNPHLPFRPGLNTRSSSPILRT